MAQLQDGLVALPSDARNKEQLEWISEEIIEAGGQATVWVAYPTTAAQERELVAAMMMAIFREYTEIIEEAAVADGDPTAVRQRTLRRLRRQLRRVRQRDYFPSNEREEAHAAVEQLAVLVEAS
ncbi:MAG: Chromate resistance protein ChrB [Actinomycetota bacterium]